MAQRVYATPDEYRGFAEEAFDGDDQKLAKRLRSASIEVERMVRLAVYDVDDEGAPTGDSVKEGFAEAACAIVEYWEETGDPTGAEALDGAVKIGSVSLGTTSSGGDTDTARDKLVKRVGGKAVNIIENLRLFSGPGY